MLNIPKSAVASFAAGCLVTLVLGFLTHTSPLEFASPRQLEIRPTPASNAQSAAGMSNDQSPAEMSSQRHQQTEDSMTNVGSEEEADAAPSWTAFYDFIREFDACAQSRMYGGRRKKTSDGHKLVCLDGGLAPRPGNCLVLSFGINNEWSFDDAMEQYGCKVFSFDPTMNRTEHIRGKSIHFLPMGLGGSHRTVKGRRNKSFEVYSYRDILGKINKTDSIIDYLKIDIEGYEVDFFQNVLQDDVQLLANVKQIGMEIHPGKSEPTRDKLWRHMHRLLDLGFTSVSSEINMFGKNSFTYNNKRESCCYEIVWVNTRLK